MSETRQGPNRRGVLAAIATGGGALACAALAVPSARFVALPAQGGAGGGRWIKTVRVESLTEGHLVRVELVSDRRDAWTLEKQVALGAAWLRREGDRVRAWSVVCPHLGCAIEQQGEQAGMQRGFSCPCHDSTFDDQGRRLTGPSPRDLDALDTRVEDGFVLVEFRRFRQGTPEKTSIG
jgi:menaquinol-cytochrome c reductase iron-sulfur subunit